jgi:hypothetical protein
LIIKNRKTKETAEVRKVKSMSWGIRKEVDPNGQSGTYFLRTSLAGNKRRVALENV